ncbi:MULTISPECIES: hypothetical protein [Derxia]|uniref:Uncharacterized protein n=1 Tax=Derxia gummosa DSM 723 TaxID=1121388 RepID=A0A8B6XBW8_9BURK|nr:MULTISPECIES: hypothetical protein [Derxia]
MGDGANLDEAKLKQSARGGKRRCDGRDVARKTVASRAGAPPAAAREGAAQPAIMAISAEMAKIQAFPAGTRPSCPHLL